MVVVKVWLLWVNVTEYDGPSLMGVYATEAVAREQMARELAAEAHPNPDDWRVDECDVQVEATEVSG